jgi:hypothetical protein
MTRLLLLLLVLPMAALGQEKTETREMVGQIGSRSALLVLHATERADGGWQMTGEYLLLATFTRRFLEGERSPQLGVATLKEGASAIFFGRPATGELRGRLQDGSFRGTRYGPGGQERERFEFTEEFPAMDAYSAAVRCDAGDGRYASTLQFAIEAGRLKGALEWTSRAGAEGHSCQVRVEQAQALKGGLRVTSGPCTVTLRDLGDYVKVAAEDCAAQCGSGAYLEPLLVDRRGNCRLLRPEPR